MLKLEPPAERTKTVVSDWITGVHPRTKSEKWNVAIMSEWLKKVYRRLREEFHKSRIEEPPDLKQQFMPTSSMHETYAGKSSPDLVGVGRIAGADPLTSWVSTWRLLYLFKVWIPMVSFDARSERMLMTLGQTLWVPRNWLRTWEGDPLHCDIGNGVLGGHHGYWWYLGTVPTQDWAGYFWGRSLIVVLANHIIRILDETCYDVFSDWNVCRNGRLCSSTRCLCSCSGSYWSIFRIHLEQRY